MNGTDITRLKFLSTGPIATKTQLRNAVDELLYENETLQHSIEHLQTIVKLHAEDADRIKREFNGFAERLTGKPIYVLEEEQK